MNSLHISCRLAPGLTTSRQPAKGQQAGPDVCCALRKDQASKQTAQPAVVPQCLFAAAASLAVLLSPQPAAAAATATYAPREIMQVAQSKSLAPEDPTFRPENSIPGDSSAQEAAARANPPPFDPVVIGGTAGILLLAFGISTGRADPQLKMASSSKPSSDGGKSSGDRVAEVKNRKKQARSWIGDWQKRTKKSS